MQDSGNNLITFKSVRIIVFPINGIHLTIIRFQILTAYKEMRTLLNVSNYLDFLLSFYL